VLFCHPESEAKAAKHKGLGKQKGFLGAPGIAFLEPDGEGIVQVPASTHSVAQFEHYGQRAQQLLAWRAAAAKGDARAVASLLVAQLEERQVGLDVATARRRDLKSETDAERARLDELLLDLRISAEIGAVQNDLPGRRELGKKYLAMLAKGTLPSPMVTRGLWFVIMEHAEATGDPAAFEVGLQGMRRNVQLTAGGEEWGAKLVLECEGKLAALRSRK
jgi:hypothetical protein